MDNSLYAFFIKPYTIHDDEGNSQVIEGDVYISRMPVDEPVSAAWFTDGEHCGSCEFTPEMLKTAVLRIVHIG